MGRLSQASVVELRKELAYSFEIPFEEKCFEILSNFFNPLEKVQPRSKLDSSGIDFFGWDSNNYNFEHIFQCKGFQVKVFGESQFNNCKHSIETFLTSTQITNNYYLIINRPISSEYIKLLNVELAKIVSAKKSKHVFLLDIYKFLNFVYDKQIEVLNSEIELSHKHFLSEFSSVMDTRFYLEEIPFEIDNTQKNNPLKHILEKCRKGSKKSQSHSSEFIKGKYLFIISEFGFGKTSLMLNLFDHLHKHDFTPIYLPVATFASDGFSTSANFCREILRIIGIHENESFTTYNRFKGRVFKNILDNNPKIILLLDGLDEHKFLKKDTNLKILFNWIKDIKAVPIFSIRKEFWEERSGNFLNAIGKTRKIQDKLYLTEWKENEIINYIDTYLQTNDLQKKSEILNIQEFRKIVLQKKYCEYYGDIPRRPLFLAMVIEDVRIFSARNRTLTELYIEYLKQKTVRDRFGEFQTFTPDRHLPYDWDTNQLIDALFQIQEYSASKMYTIEEGRVILTNNLRSSEIDEKIKEFGFDSINDILLHSVLVTTKERKGFTIELKFAHFSFLEFFFSLYIVEQIEKDSKWFSYKYEVSTKKFINEFLILNDKISLIHKFSQ